MATFNNDDFEQYFSRSHLTDQAKTAILTMPDADKTQLLQDCQQYQPLVYDNYGDPYGRIQSYAGQAPTDYPESGTVSEISSLISKMQADRYNATHPDSVAFYDPAYTHYRDQDIDASLEGLNGETLMLGALETAKCTGPNQLEPSHFETLQKLLASDKLAKFKQVIIPLTIATETQSHMTSLILDLSNPNQKKYVWIDQCGKDGSYNQSKEAIRNALAGAGFTGKENEDAITQNRNDCAIFAAMVNGNAIGRSLDDAYNTTIGLNPNRTQDAQVHQMTDDANKFFKDNIEETYLNMHLNNPLFKKFLELNGVDPISAPLDKKKELFDQFMLHNTMEVNGVEQEITPDLNWQDEVRAAVTYASNQLNSNFEEYPDPDYPDRLCFRSGENNRMLFSARNKVEVAGDQLAFDTLVLAARDKLGMNKITFGQFQQHPEYAARLYLACLKYGMEMDGNKPDETLLQQFGPEYAAIQAERARQQQEAEQRRQEEFTRNFPDKLQEANKKLEDSQEKFYSDPTCQDLIRQLKEEKNKLRTAADDATKATIQQNIQNIKNTIVTNPLGDALNASVKEKSELLKDAVKYGIVDAEIVKKYGQSTEITPDKLTKRENESDADFALRKSKWENWINTQKNDPEAQKEVKKDTFKQGVNREIKKAVLSNNR